MNFFTFYKLWFVKTTFLRIKKLQARRFVIIIAIINIKNIITNVFTNQEFVKEIKRIYKLWLVLLTSFFYLSDFYQKSL